MFPIIIEGSTSGSRAEVNSDNELKTALQITQPVAPFVAVASRNKALRVSENFRVPIGQDLLLFYDNFQIINTPDYGNWRFASGTWEIRAGQLVYNPTLVNTATSGSAQTRKFFPIFKQFSTRYEFNLQVNSYPTQGLVAQWGTGYSSASGSGAMDYGFFFKYSGNGSFYCVACSHSGGTFANEYRSPTLDAKALIDLNTMHKFIIDARIDGAKFYIDDVLVAEITLPQGNAGFVGNYPISIVQNYNAGDSSRLPTPFSMRMGSVSVSVLDIGNNKPWSHIMSGMQKSAGCIPTGAGGQSVTYTNSMAAGAGVAMAQSSPNAALAGLGGQFAVLPTLTANTDGILCYYLIPVASTAIQGKTLYITGVRIQGAVTTALTGGAVLYFYALGVGNTSNNLATSDTAITKAPRRIPLGVSMFAANAVVGTVGTSVYMQFKSPVKANSGEYVHIIAKNLGVVTTTGVITHLVTFDGYWE